MSLGLFFSGGGANQNLDNTYERLGFNSNGTGKALAGSNSANTKGNGQSLGSTTADWKGFWLNVVAGSGTSHRFLIDIATEDTFTNVIVPNYFAWPSTTSGAIKTWIPIQVASGTTLWARCQASVGGTTSVQVAVIGALSNMQSEPLYTAMTALNIGEATTLPSTIDVALNSASYTTLVNSTGAAYGAWHIVSAYNGTTPGTSQPIDITVASGASSETPFAWDQAYAFNSSPQSARCYTASPFLHSIASGQRISAKIAAGITGSDNFRIGLYGFS